MYTHAHTSRRLYNLMEEERRHDGKAEEVDELPSFEQLFHLCNPPPLPILKILNILKKSKKIHSHTVQSHYGQDF